MCAQGTDTEFKDLERTHCRNYKGCFPRWKHGCPKGCSQWIDRKRVTGSELLWAYLTEDNSWYILDHRLCQSLEKWEYPVIDSKVFDARVSQICRNPAKDVTPIRPIFQGVIAGLVFFACQRATESMRESTIYKWATRCPSEPTDRQVTLEPTNESPMAPR
jgi:hypothetical protein